MAKPKNIIVFMTDDHGQWALGSSGNPTIQTPNLDYLARTGVVMENAFTPTPVCSPARANFLTGKTSSQHGVHDYLDNDPHLFERDWLANETTIATLLAKEGYATGMVGKWHLGNDPVRQHGFHDWFSLAGDYPIDATGSARYSTGSEFKTIRGSKADILTDAAVQFLRSLDGTKPFFLFVCHVSTHSEWAGHPERLVSRYRGLDFREVPQTETYPFGEQNLESRDLIDRSHTRDALAQYYAAVTNIDEGVGRVISELDTLDLRDQTLIVYTSDHGLNCGHHGIWGKGNGTLPLNMVEESIRVPLILSCPSSLPVGQRRKELVDHLDLFQTLLDFASLQRPKGEYAGQSYLDLLVTSQTTRPWRQSQCCEFGTVRMIKSSRYKFVEHYEGAKGQLFDLLNDPREMRDVMDIAASDQTVRKLMDKLSRFYERFSAPKKSGRRLGGPELTNATSPWAANHNP